MRHERFMFPHGNESNKKKGWCELVHFSSCWSLIEHNDEQVASGAWSETNDGDNKWRFGSSLKDLPTTRYHLLEGVTPSATLEEIQRLRQQLEASGTYRTTMAKAASSRRQRKFADSGSELDIDRYLAGDANCWSVTQKGKQAPLVRLGVNLALSSGNSEREFAKLVALLGLTADVLTTAGFSLEILGLMTVHNLSDTFEEGGLVVTLKAADQPLDLPRLGSVSAPGLLRHYGFNAYAKAFTGNICSSYGECRPTTEPLKEHLQLSHLYSMQWLAGKSTEQQVLFVDNLLQKLNGEVVDLAI